jgi:hypothetical protein
VRAVQRGAMAMAKLYATSRALLEARITAPKHLAASPRLWVYNSWGVEELAVLNTNATLEVLRQATELRSCCRLAVGECSRS